MEGGGQNGEEVARFAHHVKGTLGMVNSSRFSSSRAPLALPPALFLSRPRLLSSGSAPSGGARYLDAGSHGARRRCQASVCSRASPFLGSGHQVVRLQPRRVAELVFPGSEQLALGFLSRGRGLVAFICQEKRAVRFVVAPCRRQHCVLSCFMALSAVML